MHGCPLTLFRHGLLLQSVHIIILQTHYYCVHFYVWSHGQIDAEGMIIGSYRGMEKCKISPRLEWCKISPRLE